MTDGIPHLGGFRPRYDPRARRWVDPTEDEDVKEPNAEAMPDRVTGVPR